MITLKIKTLEKKIGKIQKYITVLGIDTGSRLGWALIRTGQMDLTIDYGILDIKSSSVYYKYDKIIEFFSNIITSDMKLIIEDTFYKLNPRMFRTISRMGMIPYVIGKLNNCQKKFITASQARKNLGISGNTTKEVVMYHLKKYFGIKIKEHNIADAIVLGLNGILKEE